MEKAICSACGAVYGSASFRSVAEGRIKAVSPDFLKCKKCGGKLQLEIPEEKPATDIVWKTKRKFFHSSKLVQFFTVIGIALLLGAILMLGN